MLLLPLTQIGGNSVQIIVELFGMLLANRSNFIDNWIGDHAQSSINSSGVQITGHL